MTPKKTTALFNYVSFWFTVIARCLKGTKDRIKIEACIGDISYVLEQIRYGFVGHRLPQPVTSRSADSDGDDMREICPQTAATEASIQGKEDDTMTDVTAESSTKELDAPTREIGREDARPELKDYSRMYDRIHLSNIPDYVGGTLTSFMYSLPLTWPGDSSYITANCLRNPPRWQSVAYLNNEYIELSSPSDLEKTFHVRMEPMLDPNAPLVMTEYARWHHCKKSKVLSDLMPRPAFETRL